MTDIDAAAFVERFRRIWENPDPDQYAQLWHSDGVLRHPTMSEPLPQERIPDYIRRLQSVAPDLSLSVERWAARDDAVLIEWTLRATLGEAVARIAGVDRFTLRGDRATEGVAYFDTMALWARLDPAVNRDESLEDRLQQMAAQAQDS